MASDLLKEQLSAYFDGELNSVETAMLLKQIESDSELRKQFDRYQLIHDVIRNQVPASIDMNFADRVMAQLSEEPELKANPAISGLKKYLKPLTGLGIAASVAIIALASVQFFQATFPGYNGGSNIADNGMQGTRWAVKRQEVGSRLNSLLVNHYEFTSSNSIKGMFPFVPIVVYDAQRKPGQKVSFENNIPQKQPGPLPVKGKENQGD